MLLLSAIYARAVEAPWRPALLFAKNDAYVQLSYADLVDELERWARRYLALGLAPRSTIAIVFDHRIEAYGAYLGAMRAGLLPTFLAYPTPKQKEAVYWPAQRDMFALLEPGCVVTYAAVLERIVELTAHFACTAVDIDAPWTEHAVALPALETVEAAELQALIQLSSGTTGARKSVALTFGQIEAQVDALRTALPAVGLERTLSWAPVYHDMGLITAFLLPMSVGSSVVAIDAFEWLARPSMFLELIERFAITDAWLPNFALNHLVRTFDRAKSYDLSSIRTIVTVAESIREETLESFLRTFVRFGLRSDALRCAYGLAENVLLCTITRAGSVRRTAALPGSERRFVSVGSTLPGTEIDVVSATDDGVGEIVVRGRCVIREYYRSPEATAQAFHEGWLRTGDLGFMRDGETYVCGRIKEVLVVHGQNFYASDIEAIVSSVVGVKPGRNVAIARFEPSTSSDEACVLAETELCDADGRLALVREIRSTIYNHLGLQVRSVHLLSVGELIKTTSGKMSRAENAARFASGAFLSYA